MAAATASPHSRALNSPALVSSSVEATFSGAKVNSTRSSSCVGGNAGDGGGNSGGGAGANVSRVICAAPISEESIVTRSKSPRRPMSAMTAAYPVISGAS